MPSVAELFCNPMTPEQLKMHTGPQFRSTDSKNQQGGPTLSQLYDTDQLPEQLIARLRSENERLTQELTDTQERERYNGLCRVVAENKVVKLLVCIAELESQLSAASPSPTLTEGVETK